MCDSDPKLFASSQHNIRPRILSRPSFLHYEPRETQENPYASCKCYQYAEAPIVIRCARIYVQTKHDSYNHSQDDNLTERLNIKCGVGQLIPLHAVCEIVFFPCNHALCVLLSLIP